MLSYPAPLICQYDDLKLVLEISSRIFPNVIRQHSGENGLRVWVDGTSEDHPEAGVRALAHFQVALGVLRTWSDGAGTLAHEERGGLATGSVRDENGTQYIFPPSTVLYTSTETVAPLAEAAATGIRASSRLRNALWLFGRENRTAADYYMIYEYAEAEFSGSKGVTRTLGMSGKLQKRLTNAMNNLSPLEGGRHAPQDEQKASVPLSLDAQRAVLGQLLKAWIRLYA